jgi:hypothetical protein
MLSSTGSKKTSATRSLLGSPPTRPRWRSPWDFAAPPRPGYRATLALCRAEVSRACGDSGLDTWAATVTAADAAGYSTRRIYARWRLTEALLEHSIRDRAEAALREAAHRATAIKHERRPARSPLWPDARGYRSRPIPARPHPPTSVSPHARPKCWSSSPTASPTADRRNALHQRQDRRAPRSRILGKLGVTTRTGRRIASPPAWDPADRREPGVTCAERGPWP